MSAAGLVALAVLATASTGVRSAPAELAAARWGSPSGGVAGAGLVATPSPRSIPPGVVLLFAQVSDVTGSAGTALVLSSTGLVLTNAHVVRGSHAVLARDVSSGRGYPAVVLGVDRRADIAVLRLRGATGLSAAVLGDSDAVRVGQPVVAVGNVGGQGRAVRAVGKVTALDRDITSRDIDGATTEHLEQMIETDARVRPGDSGGPLFSATGAVLGVNTSASPRHGYAIPINIALRVAHHLAAFPDTGAVSRRHWGHHPGQSQPAAPPRSLLTARLGLGDSPRAHPRPSRPRHQLSTRHERSRSFTPTRPPQRSATR